MSNFLVLPTIFIVWHFESISIPFLCFRQKRNFSDSIESTQSAYGGIIIANGFFLSLIAENSGIVTILFTSVHYKMSNCATSIPFFISPSVLMMIHCLPFAWSRSSSGIFWQMDEFHSYTRYVSDMTCECFSSKCHGEISFGFRVQNDGFQRERKEDLNLGQIMNSVVASIQIWPYWIALLSKRTERLPLRKHSTGSNVE